MEKTPTAEEVLDSVTKREGLTFSQPSVIRVIKLAMEEYAREKDREIEGLIEINNINASKLQVAEAELTRLKEQADRMAEMLQSVKDYHDAILEHSGIGGWSEEERLNQILKEYRK